VRESCTLQGAEQSENPPHGIFMSVGRPDGRRGRDWTWKPFPISCGTGVGCSGHCSV